MNLEAAKRELRRRARDQRKEFAAAATLAAERICEHLFAEPAFRRAGQVAIYAALPDEVPTRPLFDALTSAGTVCLLPRVVPAGPLVFARVEHWDELRPGRLGILEPVASAPTVAPGAGDVAIVPGVAFDLAGWRLGRGGGYYDRTFPAGAGPQPLLFGVACEARIAESVPHGSHDRAMDAIVTERAFQWARGDG